MKIETDVAPASWRRELHAAHPGQLLRVHSFTPITETEAIEEFSVQGTEAETIAHEASSTGAEILETGAGHARIRTLTRDMRLLDAIRASGIAPRYPFESRDGHDRFMLVGERSALTRFVEALENHGLRARMITLTRHHPKGCLTPRQSELIHAAFIQGYYEVPRRVTLTALAARLHVAKSTLSEVLARGERHILRGEALAPA